jgi:hypothetical protein
MRCDSYRTVGCCLLLGPSAGIPPSVTTTAIISETQKGDILRVHQFIYVYRSRIYKTQHTRTHTHTQTIINLTLYSPQEGQGEVSGTEDTQLGLYFGTDIKITYWHETLEREPFCAILFYVVCVCVCVCVCVRACVECLIIWHTNLSVVGWLAD